MRMSFVLSVALTALLVSSLPTAADVTAQRGNGALTGITTVQRINTQGGKLSGACDQAGKLRATAYAADYVFFAQGLAALRPR